MTDTRYIALLALLAGLYAMEIAELARGWQ